jgi:integrase
MVRYVSRRQLSMQWIVPCGCPGTLRKIPRIHDLRHTAVAILIARNVPLSAIARRVGHESIVTTDKTYGHLLPELDARQADAMFAALQHLAVLDLVA